MCANTLDASGIAPESVLERFEKTNPGLEVWWDSSPLVYPTWAKKLIQSVPADKQPTIKAQLKRLYDPENPAKSLFRGVTTNPPLSLAAMQDNPPRWEKWISDYQKGHPKADVEEVFWALYKEIVRLGAEAFLPIFESSGYLYGHLSGQTDPRKFFDHDLMVRQGIELSGLAPNVMVKIPGTTEGVEVLRELTARGISTNCTAGYIVPQFVAVAEAIEKGLAEARTKGVDLRRWRSVVTDMSARWESAPEFIEEAKTAGVTLSPTDIRWAGIAVFKRAHEIYRERAYPSKMLICSVRMGPDDNGTAHSWHLEETAGASAVFTLPPGYLAELFTRGEGMQFESRIWKDIPADVMEKLQRVPYFRRGYELDGMAVGQFNTIEPLVSTFNEFSAATQKMVDFVRDRMQK